MKNSTVASAITSLVSSVDFDREGFDLQGFIDAVKRKEVQVPLTNWLVSKGWETPKVPLSDTAEVALDPIIRVDRSIRPSYPDWMKEVMHPELEGVGPSEYDISAVEQWLHKGQEGGKWIEGNKIYKHLKETDTLKTCLGLRDLEEIQKKGIAFFRKYFKGKAVFGWAGIVRLRFGNLHVPCLFEYGDKVVLDWSWTDYDWNDSNPALRFASSPKA